MPADSTYPFARLRQQQATYDTAFAPKDLPDALPSKVHRVAGRDLFASDEVVTGRFRSWSSSAEGLTASFVVDRVVDIRAGVRHLDSHEVVPVRLRVATSTDAHRMGAGLVALGPSIVYLSAPSAGPTWSVAWNGQLVGRVTGGDRAEAPAFQPLRAGATTTTVSALSASADANHLAHQRATESAPSVPPARRGSAVDLVPVVWRVRGAAGEADRTWVRFDGSSVQVLRPKGQVLVVWRPQGTRFVAAVEGWSMSLGTKEPPTAPWLTDAVSFARSGAGWELRDAAGHVTATLLRDGAPPPSKQTSTEAPTVTKWVRAQLADAKPGRGVHAVEPARIVGRWVVPGFDSKIALTLEADGRWKNSTNCETGTGAVGGSGRFRLERDGVLLSVGFPAAGVGCSDPDIAPPADANAITDFERAASVVLDGDALTVFDREGTRIGTLHRGS